MNDVLELKKSPVQELVEPKTYIASVTKINTYCLEVTSSELPALSLPPKNWEDFIALSVDIKTQTLSWINNVFVNLTNLPSDICAKEQDINIFFKSAKENAQALVNTGDNAKTRYELQDNLEILETIFRRLSIEVAGLLKKIETYNSEIPTLSANFNELIQDFSNTISYDQKAVQKCKQTINELQADINELIAEIVSLVVAEGGIMFLSRLASKIKNKAAKGAAKFLTFGFAMFILGEIFDAIFKITAKAQEINLQTQFMDSYTLDITKLEAVNLQYQDFANNIDDVKKNIKTIANTWESIADKLVKAKQDLKNADEESQAKHFSNALKSITTAQEDWQEVYDYVQKINVTYQIKDIEFDMEDLPSQDESTYVQAEKTNRLENSFNDAKAYSLLEYYNVIV